MPPYLFMSWQHIVPIIVCNSPYCWRLGGGIVSIFRGGYWEREQGMFQGTYIYYRFCLKIEFWVLWLLFILVYFTTYVCNNNAACEIITILIRNCKLGFRFMDFICGEGVWCYSLSRSLLSRNFKIKTPICIFGPFAT